tara:strand:- start:752 stop:1546 length:795 start_codon:yes stop_codon:yes gene_type:complete
MSAFTDEEKRKFIALHNTNGQLFEDVMTDIYKRWIAPGMTVIDAGANHGHHTFQLSDAVGPDGLVVAIEAIPRLVAEIEYKLEANNRRNVRMVCGALSSTSGIAQFFHRSDMDGWSSLFSAHVPPESEEQNLRRFLTPMFTLDLLTAHIDSCRFMKLDLEMNEFPAMLGGRKLIRGFRPLMVFENSRQHAADLADFTADEFFTFMSELGYRVYDIFFDPLTRENWHNEDSVPVYNIAVHQSQEDRLLQLPIRQIFEASPAAVNT